MILIVRNYRLRAQRTPDRVLLAAEPGDAIAMAKQFQLASDPATT
jgi:hypothetical protein